MLKRRDYALIGGSGSLSSTVAVSRALAVGLAAAVAILLLLLAAAHSRTTILASDEPDRLAANAVHAVTPQELTVTQTVTVTAAPAAQPTSTQCSTSEAVRTFRQTLGAHSLRTSVVHAGSAHRLHRQLSRAAAGESLKVAIIGGSVSTGHGATKKGKLHAVNAIPYARRWHQVFFDWFKETYPVRVGKGHEFRDGSKPAVDSTFFEFCFASKIGMDADLIMVEMAVNDEFEDSDESSMSSSESLLRHLLLLPSSPAVIFVDAFSLRTKSGRGGMRNGGDAHTSLASYYDVPQVSLRNPLLPALVKDGTLSKPWFGGDARHIAAELHAVLGQLLSAVVAQEQCLMEQGQPDEEPSGRTAAGADLWRGTTLLGAVPRLKLSDNWNDRKTYSSAAPTCRVSGEDLTPSADGGWKLESWRDEKYWWTTSEPDRQVSFEIWVPQKGEGTVMLGFLRSWTYDLGRVSCWVDQRTADAVVLDGTWRRRVSLAQSATVATNVKPGEHTVTCKTLRPAGKGDKKTTFRITSVMAL